MEVRALTLTATTSNASRNNDEDSNKVNPKRGMAFYCHGDPLNSCKFDVK